MIHKEVAYKVKLPSYTKKQLKEYAGIYSPRLCFLSYYIQNDYTNDIYDAYKQIIQVIKSFKKEYGIYRYNNVAILINLDDVFIQTKDFYNYTRAIWKEPKLRELYDILQKDNVLPILPYMYILYRQAIVNKIRIIFITDRPRTQGAIVRLNLSRFGVLKYNIVMNVREKRKPNVYSDLMSEYNIIATIDHQTTLNKVPRFIKFPHLYTN